MPQKNEIFLLSVMPPYAEKISSGEKLWEFRQNPNFGTAGDFTMKPGDSLFIIEIGGPGQILCCCRVVEILRLEAFKVRFSDFSASCWKEAGYSEGTENDDIKHKILDEYSVTVKLEPFPLEKPIPTEEITQRFTGKPWNGRGFTHVSQLRKFAVIGENVEDYLLKLGHKKSGK